MPKLRDNFHDVFAELEKELAKDPNMAFSEAADSPIDEVYDTLGTVWNKMWIITFLGHTLLNEKNFMGKFNSFRYW